MAHRVQGGRLALDHLFRASAFVLHRRPHGPAAFGGARQPSQPCVRYARPPQWPGPAAGRGRPENGPQHAPTSPSRVPRGRVPEPRCDRAAKARRRRGPAPGGRGTPPPGPDRLWFSGGRPRRPRCPARCTLRQKGCAPRQMRRPRSSSRPGSAPTAWPADVRRRAIRTPAGRQVGCGPGLPSRGGGAPSCGPPSGVVGGGKGAPAQPSNAPRPPPSRRSGPARRRPASRNARGHPTTRSHRPASALPIAQVTVGRHSCARRPEHPVCGAGRVAQRQGGLVQDTSGVHC